MRKLDNKLRFERSKRPSEETGKTRGRQTLGKILATACSLAVSLTAFGQDYHSNDLTPAGSSAGRLNSASRGKQVGAAQMSNGYSHAVVPRGNALAATDLNPTNYWYSMAMCSDDFQEGGWGYAMTGGIHALVWDDQSSSYAELNPSGYSTSYCLGIYNGEQVGYAQNQVYFVTASHAMCWHGSADSVVDLHPISSIYPYS